MKYPRDKCHFCGGELENSTDATLTYKCKDMVCRKKHYYTVDNITVWFMIDGYEFYIFHNGETRIKPPSPATICIDYSLDFNPENYLDQLERIKKLKIFK